MSQVNPFDEFGPEVSESIDGLLHLGEISSEIEFCGHTFGLRTLRADEEIASAKVVESYRETLKEAEAWAAAQVGMALTHLDGNPDFCPAIGPDKVSFARARFQYVTSNWYPPTINYLYGEYVKLLEKQIAAIRAAQDLSPRSQPTFLPSLDSLNDPGTFDAQTVSETLA